MSAYGCYVKFTARPGQRDALVEHLLRAAASAGASADCVLYIVNISPTEPEVVWVTELWLSQQAHDAPLATEEARAAIRQVLPLLSGTPEKVDILPVAGKGFTPP